MSFNKFNHLTDNRVDWLNLTNRIYSKLNSTIKININELVIVSDIEYYKGVTELLEKTSNRVIANYLGWRTVMNFGSYTTKKFREIIFEFNNVVSGVEQVSERWRDCISYLSDSLQYPVSRLYVDKKFSQKDKQQVCHQKNEVFFKEKNDKTFQFFSKTYNLGLNYNTRYQRIV